MSDQPTRDANGNLRDAADMEFYESESEGFEELLSPVMDLRHRLLIWM
jgi:hypothetical protein